MYGGTRNTGRESESGSTKFGDSLDDTHKFTGSLYVTGSFVVPSVQTLPVSSDTGSIVIFNNSLYICV